MAIEMVPSIVAESSLIREHSRGPYRRVHQVTLHHVVTRISILPMLSLYEYRDGGTQPCWKILGYHHHPSTPVKTQLYHHINNMADQGVQEEDLYITTTTITLYDNFTGTLERYTIIRGIWFEEVVFANVRRQVFVIRPIHHNAPGPRPIPHDHTQPPSGDGHNPSMPTSTGDGSDTQSHVPNQDYQAHVAPLLARLRGQGVEFNETPRRFNLAADLAHAPRAASSSSARGNTSSVARQTSAQRRDIMQPTGFVSDGHAVWSLPGPEPDHDSGTNREGGSGL
ncbi:hypothetical protein M436DRAFT_65625 [Aureobasidium namibiae CBS 147.97]|uniref:Uncharacterized protein n=1 Tax=Aureobasidium namibiae CBS 147.97 TaxID=1043004 RepID=A0A074WEJ1_9PEZI